MTEEKLLYIGNAFPVQNIRLQAAHDLPPEIERIFQQNRCIVAVGNTNIYKGHWYLLRVFSQLVRKVQDVKLFIIGEGDLYHRLVSFAQQLGLIVFDSKAATHTGNEQVYFLGGQKNPYAYMKRATLFALSSLTEGSPNVLNEALICRTPVMAADCRSGPREILLPAMEMEATLTHPAKSDFGYLMPPFEFKVAMENTALSPAEQQWLETLTAQFDGGNGLGYHQDLEAYTQTLDISFSLAKWQSLIDGRL
jgi:glycosyltransferase involved in cell wall biosynthesis